MIFTVLLFLLLGHVVGDFVLQSRALAEGKRDRAAALAAHIGLVLAAHVACLLPLLWFESRLSIHWLWIVPVLVLAHAVIDAGKAAVERRNGESLRTFLVDQALHAVCVIGAAVVAVDCTAATAAMPEGLQRAAILAIAYVLCATAGSAVVRLVLARYTLPPPPVDGDEAQTAGTMSVARMGHAIGVLERSLGLTFILLDAWAGLGGIIAAKSIARFKDLERRHFGEYYLVGTLTSLLVTVAVGLAALGSLALV